ncbi:MAG: hypothetical protein RL329_1376 [Bacteroidota bacterium]
MASAKMTCENAFFIENKFVAISNKCYFCGEINLDRGFCQIELAKLLTKTFLH